VGEGLVKGRSYQGKDDGQGGGVVRGFFNPAARTEGMGSKKRNGSVGKRERKKESSF